MKNAGNLTGRMGPRRPVTDEGAGAPTIAKAFSSPATGEKTRQLTVRVPESLHREVRVLTALAFARDQRQPQEPVFSAYKIWDKRKPLLQQTLQRLTLADCRSLLNACARIDRAIKGAEPGAPWDELLATGLRLAGLALLPEES